jgi:hypothetical protein
MISRSRDHSGRQALPYFGPSVLTKLRSHGMRLLTLILAQPCQRTAERADNGWADATVKIVDGDRPRARHCRPGLAQVLTV